MLTVLTNIGSILYPLLSKVLPVLHLPVNTWGFLSGEDLFAGVGIMEERLIRIAGTLAETGSRESLIDFGKFGDRIYVLFDRSPTLVVVLYTVIIYSILALTILTVFILLNRRRMEKTAILENELNEKYQGLLVDYFFRKDIADEVEKTLGKIANNDFKRRILINQIIDMSINMQGDEKEQLRELYLKLGLKGDSLKKVYSKKWHENIKGFRELAYMNIREANDRIIKMLNSPNKIMRMEAQIALVRLSDENPYEFLDFLDQPLSVWEQITIHELLTQHNLNAPDFKQWFESPNLTIVRFSLQMVARFEQVNALPGVIKLLKHEDEEIRKAAIRTCGYLKQTEALPHLEEMYYDEPPLNREEILKSFGKIPDEKFLEFLNGVLDNEEDVRLQILATKAMENLDEPGISRLIKLMKSKSEYKNYRIIIRHVLDRRIY